MMYCPYCGTDLTAEAVFCRHCGKRVQAETPPAPVTNVQPVQSYCEEKEPHRQAETPPSTVFKVQPVQSYYEEKEAQRQKELSTLNGLMQYFSQKQDVYDRYDNACSWINRLSRGCSNALLIWGAIVSGLYLLIALLILSEAYSFQEVLTDLLMVALFVLLPGLGMLAGGITKKVRHRNLTNQYLQEYTALSMELHQHYMSCPRCPIMPECSNPRIIILVQNAIASGCCDTIKQGINNVFTASRYAGIAQYQEVTLQNTSSCNLQYGLKYIFLPARFFR